MLEMRPACECCGIGLPADVPGANICSAECTFCTPCTADVLKGQCPNCGGDLSPRPTRKGTFLARHPATTERIVKQGGCEATP